MSVCLSVCACLLQYMLYICTLRGCVLVCICLRSSSNEQPSLPLSMLMHQCCFKCLLPWKQAARVKVLYPSFIQFSLLPCLFLCYLSILCCFVPSFSSVSFTPSSWRRPTSSPTPLFIQCDVFTSLNSFTSTSLPCSHISVSSSPFIILSTCHVILFISLSFHSSTFLPQLHPL